MYKTLVNNSYSYKKPVNSGIIESLKLQLTICIRCCKPLIPQQLNLIAIL